MQDLNISLVQADLKWEDKVSNLAMFDNILKSKVPNDTHLVVLPEMFSTGFSMNPKLLVEKMDGFTMNWLKGKASEGNFVIAGSLIIEEEGKFFNRFVWMRPDGSFEIYNKRHLFTMAGEQNHYTAGNQKLIVELYGWRFCPIICYDLRFPVWIRNMDNYDCLLVVANWPEKRIMHWDPLVISRAIENQTYVIAVNRVGDDGNGIHHNGHSMVVNPLGRQIIHSEELETVLSFSLNYNIISEVRKNMPFLNDLDSFSFD